MCGLVGILSKNKSIEEAVIKKMTAKLHHRGPDDQGIWVEGNIGLGHARLSIHDLSSAGHQPMFSHSGRWVIAFNGEVYNYRQLAKELSKEAGIHFQSDSDTEVLVNAIDVWGLEKTLKKCKGMFAFCCWDRKEKRFYVARDRFGEKPLYYGQVNNFFVCASELKAISAEFKAFLSVDRNVLSTYMRYGYVPAPYSIYENIFKLEPGNYAEINSDYSLDIKQYWSAIEVALSGYNAPLDLSFREATNTLEDKLKSTLSNQMSADVPLGAFLSGGIDSSTIVALMQSLSSKKIQTFSIGFHEKEYNEAPHAKAVAEYLKTEHTELYVTAKQALDVIPKLPEIYDEPFADSSQIPTFLVSQLTKQHVTVSLSGDAGDEIFGGYGRYFFADKVKKNLLSNKFLTFLIRHFPSSLLSMVDFLPSNKISSDKVKKIQAILSRDGNSFANFYRSICTQQCERPNDVVLSSHEHDIFEERNMYNLKGHIEHFSWMMLLDTVSYLRDDILTKVDRAAMAVGLETRVPFLDHKIFEFAWRLPLKYKASNGVGKKVLKSLLYKYVPQSLVERPKKGFGIPYGDWLKTDLKDWACELLDPTKLTHQGFFNTDDIQKIWKEHESGKRNWQGILWCVLMFQAWHSYFR